MASSRFQTLSEIGSLAEDDDAFPALEVYFYCAHGAESARRDLERDAEFERSLRGHLFDGP